MIQEEPIVATSKRQGIVSRIRQRIARTNWEVTGPKLLGTVCVLILGGMLGAGLWPFHSPRNQVAWFAGGNGLQFGRHGTVLSSGTLKSANAQQNAPCSIEVWLEPDSTGGGGTILAFYAPGSRRQFSLQQSISDLVVRSDSRDGRYRTRTTNFYVGDIFRRGKPLFITVTSNGRQTSVYIDGKLAETAPNFPLSGKDFEGELVIATWPREDDSWSGLLRGLAIYHQELSSAQVLQHFETWKEKGRPDVSQNEGAVAIYPFDEHAGRVVHNQVPLGTDLYIPERYMILDQAFLSPFWEEFHPNWGYWDDVLVNIGGFVPFGFICCAYFSLAGRFRKPGLFTILLGFMVSLTIEVLQAYLPTRNSGTTDLITNTLGTCCGVWLYRFYHWRIIMAKVWASIVGTAGK